MLEYLNIFTSHGFINVLKHPTRLSSNSATLIDHIFTNDFNSTNFTSGILTSDISDHFPSFIMINDIMKIKSKDQIKEGRNFSKYNLKQFKEGLASYDWSYITECTDVQTAYDLFWKNLSYFFDIFLWYQKKLIAINIKLKSG